VLSADDCDGGYDGGCDCGCDGEQRHCEGDVGYGNGQHRQVVATWIHRGSQRQREKTEELKLKRQSKRKANEKEQQ
jgi:hypothetical protein